MVKSANAANAGKAAALLDLNRVLTRSYKIQITTGLSNRPWKADHLILGTRADPNLVCMDAMNESWRTPINVMKQQRLRSAAGTYLRVVENVRLVTKIGQPVAKTGFLVVENLKMNVLLETIFIGNNVRPITPRKQLIRAVSSHSVSMLGTERVDFMSTYVSDQEEASVDSMTTKFTAILGKTEAAVLARVPVADVHIWKRTPIWYRVEWQWSRKASKNGTETSLYNLCRKLVKCSDHSAKNVLMAQYTPALDTFWLKPFEGDRIDRTQLCKEAKSKEKNFRVALCSDAGGRRELRKALYRADSVQQEVLRMVAGLHENDEKVSEAWYGYLKEVSDEKHCNNLNSLDASPIHAAPYRAARARRTWKGKNGQDDQCRCCWKSALKRSLTNRFRPN